ncbi:MAG: ATP-dependent helicase [Leptospiraceae bacterium]|nr:ATP-dependent helicase [Leptospiraceae bacterium]MCP5494099.1 ATP-dependent helicase [Leptospiraceae bacterium]
MQYTKSQLKAIQTIDKNLLIVACAGSGKTQVISKRIITILKTQNIKPENIIAFTYTEKAAVELKNRILRIASEEQLSTIGMAELFVGTIHAWCLKVLQENILEYQKFSVLDDIKLKLFIDRYYEKSGMRELGLKIYQETGIFIQLMSILRESEIINPTQIPKEFLDALEKYETLLKKYCYFDYTMIMSQTLGHLQENQEFSEKLRARIKYLVVDEYQDINPVQENLIRNIYEFGVNLCVVGDDDQTIYQWRGSDLNNILKFEERYQNVEVVKLEENHRSSKAIVETALRSIKHNKERKSKQMQAAGKLQYERGDVLYNNYSEPNEEYDFIIHQIQVLRGVAFQDKEKERGLDYADFCILVRTWNKAKEIKEKLQETEIPFIVSGVSQLFETEEVKAAKGIFDYMAGKIDSDLFLELWEMASMAIDPQKAKQAIDYLEEMKPEKIKFFDDFCLQDVYQTFLQKAEINEDSVHNPSIAKAYFNRAEIVFYNLGQFSQVIDDFETVHYNTKPTNKLKNFLNFLHYAAKDYYPEGWLSNSFKTPNAVIIMTVHQSKGLEYPVIFIPGLNKNYFPLKGQGGVSVWSKYKNEIPLIVKNYERYKGGIEDERRLFYVAVTRAQKFLFLSRAPILGNKLYQKESDFCVEISHSDYVFSDRTRSYQDRKKAPSELKQDVTNIFLNFSLLKDYFECPYRFKLVSMYGFCAPLSMRIGYGKAIHNALMDMHKRFLDGKDVKNSDIEPLLNIHFYLPYASEEGSVYADMRKTAQESLNIYYDENYDSFPDIQFAEKIIELNLGDGIIVNGRMDLVKKKNLDGSYEATIIDFKSAKDSQTYSISMEQLMLYAMGYKELTGEKADFLAVYNLDENRPHKQELKEEHLSVTKTNIINAANSIRSNWFSKTKNSNICGGCRPNKICSRC